MGTDVEVTCSHLRSKPTQKYFDVALYFSMNSIFCYLEQLSLSYASWFTIYIKYFPIHFTMEVDVELTI